MKNIKKLAKSVSWIFELGKMCSVLNVILALFQLGAVWLYYLMSGTFFGTSASLALGNVMFYLSEGFQPSTWESVLLATVEHLTTAAVSFLGYFLYKSVCAILDPLKEGQPFHHEVTVNTHRLGWLTVGMGAVGVVSETVTYFMKLNIYDLRELFLSEKILNVTTTMVADLDFILYALILFLLSWIFRHGEELQQLSDETL